MMMSDRKIAPLSWHRFYRTVQECKFPRCTVLYVEHSQEEGVDFPSRFSAILWEPRWKSETNANLFNERSHSLSSTIKILLNHSRKCESMVCRFDCSFIHALVVNGLPFHFSVF